MIACGRRMLQPVRPLGSAAIDILNELSPGKPTCWVLPGIRNPTNHIGSLDDMIERIMDLAGLDGVSAHTFRHSFASVAADMNYSDNTIGAIIGHSGSSTTSRCTHRLGNVLVAAANMITEEIKRQMS